MDLKRVNSYMDRVEKSELETFRPVSRRLKVGVDLGTAFIVVVVLDENNNPIACEKRAAGVLRDGVVVDYTGALRIVRELKEKLEGRLDTELVNCAIAMTTQVTERGAVGVLEFYSVASAITAADVAAKAANITLIEIRIGYAIGGKGYVTFTGDVGAVRAAVAAAERETEMLVGTTVIPRPSPKLFDSLL